MSYPHIITSEVITVIYQNRPLQVASGNPQYKMVLDAIKSGNWDEAIRLMDVRTVIAAWSKDGFKITEDLVTYEGIALPDILQKRIIAFWQEGQPFEPLLQFFKRLQKNPSRNSVQQLYKFLEHGNMPIDDEGFFYGYKGVRLDYRDCHSGRFDNSPGKVLSIPRNEVDDDPARGCSYGFHVGSLQYATSFGQRTVIVRVDPENVVAVPHDCGHQKLRCSGYTVVADYTGPLPETRWSVGQPINRPAVGQPVDDFEFDEDWDDEFAGWSLDEIEEQLSDAETDIAEAEERYQSAQAALVARRGY